ncbi:MAG: hypothetical protein U5J64_10290 [Halobacteriales archaeon]|nr:hypothetical protein [Halobacteriales archaeon]
MNDGRHDDVAATVVRFGVFVAVLICVLGVFVGSTTAQSVEVSDIEDLRDVSDALDGDYVLVEDIDASEESIEPIGDDDARFTGSFDGDGNVIAGLTVNGTDEEFAGLFGYVGSGGTVENVGLENVEVTGGDSTGGLVGRNGGTVRRSHVTGTVEGGNNVGGVVGRNVGEVSMSYANADVTGRERVGGLVGRNVGSISESYAIGTAVGNSDVGGAVGNNAGDLTDSYARVNVDTSTRNSGGLVGSNIGGTVRRTYSAGNVGTATSSGGFVGRNTGEITDSYWDLETAGQASSNGGVALSTEEMTGSDALRSMDSLGFDDTWETDSDGYPVLAWEVHGYDRQPDMFLPPMEDGEEDEEENETEEEETQEDYQPPGQPGFGVTAALVALIAGGALVRGKVA